MDATMHKRKVGSHLKMAIEALGLRQHQVAKEFGVSPSKLGNWVRGDNYPDEYFVKRFCERYQVSADWIYLGKVYGMPSPLADTLWKAEEASSAERAGAESQASEI